MSNTTSTVDRTRSAKSDTDKLTACLVPNTVTTTYSAVPWYLGGGTDTSMSHQKAYSSMKQLSKGPKASQAFQMCAESKLKKWHPGCCNNCGASSHETKYCVELPRKKAAKKTGNVSLIHDISPIKNELGQTEMKALSKRILSNPKYENSYQPAPIEQPKYTLREIDETPAYLQQGVLSFDPRTHAIKRDNFLYRNGDEKRTMLEDTRDRLEAIRKFNLIGESAVLPSKLDETYHQENIGHASSRQDALFRAVQCESTKSHPEDKAQKTITEADSSAKEYVPQ